jgi:hypothetical protein
MTERTLMSMDTYLAEKYGSIAEDPEMVKQAFLEKQALAEVLVKVAAENDIDLTDFDFDDVEEAEMVEALEQLLPDESEEGEATPEFQEKVAEAEYLGKVMAHTFTAERNEIEKLAMPGGKALKGLAGYAKQPGARYTSAKHQLRQAFGKGGKGKRMRHLAEAGKNIAPEAAGAAGVLGAGGAALAMKKKKSSAFDAVAEQRALEIAEHWGITKTAGDEQFEDELTYRALEMLAENGVDVDSYLE